MAIPHDPVPVFRDLFKLQPRYWRRRRVGSLGPSQVLIGVMTMKVLGTHGYERTLAEMKRELGSVLGWRTSDDVPTPSAFCQARRKLDARVCAELSARLYDLCTVSRRHAAIGYAGMRVLAEDGTKLALPAYAKIRAHFGCPSQGDGRELLGPQASFTVLWDVGANQPVTWRLGPYQDSERVHAADMVGALKRGDLLLCDRNFLSREYLTRVVGQQADALMRVRTSGIGILTEIKDFIAAETNDQTIELATSDEHGHPLIDRPTMRVRLLRAPLPTGDFAVFLTTLLDQQRHPTQTLIDVYFQRWRVETAFREMKIWHGLETFNSRSVDGIAQEVAAVMIFLLLASELEAQVRHEKNTPEPTPEPTSEPEQKTPTAQLQIPTIRFNRRIVASCAVDILYAAMAGKDIRAEFKDAMFRIWRYRQKVRPRRSFPRQRKSAPRGWKRRGTKGKGRT
jgi:hypothetical protein